MFDGNKRITLTNKYIWLIQLPQVWFLMKMFGPALKNTVLADNFGN